VINSQRSTREETPKNAAYPSNGGSKYEPRDDRVRLRLIGTRRKVRLRRKKKLGSAGVRKMVLKIWTGQGPTGGESAPRGHPEQFVAHAVKERGPRKRKKTAARRAFIGNGSKRDFQAGFKKDAPGAPATEKYLLNSACDSSRRDHPRGEEWEQILASTNRMSRIVEGLGKKDFSRRQKTR